MKIILPDRIFRGYIFDCDGTLADTMPLHFRAWARVVKEGGGEFPEAFFYQWGGRPSATIVEDLNRMMGLRLDLLETVDRKENYYLEMLHEVRAIPPVVEIARRFHGRAALAVTSGGYRKYVELTLEAIAIKELFDVIVCAEDYEHGKPHPAPFLETARRMGIPPADCLVFEDSPAGLEAAKNAGMECVYVPSREGILV
ncbi:MAG: HAD family phosphatase [Opitutaceae bacterium]|jgi:HAD superfamily hydrolase (TIGR01509 family)